MTITFFKNYTIKNIGVIKKKLLQYYNCLSKSASRGAIWESLGGKVVNPPRCLIFQNITLISDPT